MPPTATSRPATAAQTRLVDYLQTCGAPIPCKEDGGDPDMGMLASVAAADQYIKRWYHLLPNAGGKPTGMRMDEFGGVPNC